MALVVSAISILPIPAAKEISVGYRKRERTSLRCLRGERDSGTNTSLAEPCGQGVCIRSRAWSAPKRILVDIAKATMTNLTLYVFSGA